MKSPDQLLETLPSAIEAVKEIHPRNQFPPAATILSWFRDLKKSIRDPIYDQIVLNELERAVLRTPEFQRLRWIRQMDFAYLVYPAAEHSRFVHSLGVCQASKELFDQIVRNYEDQWLHASAKDEASERQSIPDFCLFDRVLVSLASMLHDLAHPAFSHAFDIRDDMLKHDDYSTNPFMLRALFDTKSSELAQVLQKWTPYFEILVRAEAKQLFPDSAHTEGLLPFRLPCLATLILELLSIGSTDDLAPNYKCICPTTPREACESEDLESLASQGWDRDPLQFSNVTVNTSRVFRRLHCDIIANTISADLLDYIRRDTQLAGIPRDLDRRFYSYISSSEYRTKQRVVVELQDRQGHVRRDALSDLMNCMEIRYIIHERIVMHRAVVSARALAARLYAPTIADPIKVWDVVEKMYGPWGRWRSDAEVLSSASPPLNINSDVSRLLRERRLYRPIVIVDDERLRRHNVTLITEAKERLATTFGAVAIKSESGAWKKLIELEATINASVIADLGARTAESIRNLLGDAPASIAVCMKPSVLFKNPRILVKVPTGLTNAVSTGATEVKELDWLSQVIPLSAHEAEQGIYDQIAALSKRYHELWRLYVFAHPALFEDRIGRVVLRFLKDRWEEEIKRNADIPALPPNIPDSELGSKDVLSNRTDENINDILRLAVKLFPTDGLVEISKAIDSSGISIDSVFNELRKQEQLFGISGVAAKASESARLTNTTSPLSTFAAFLKSISKPMAEPRRLFPEDGGSDATESA